jgi:L-aspartate oxidase
VTLADLETSNLHVVAERITAAAARRTESRGSHRRLDHPDPDPAWLRRVVQRRDRDSGAVLWADEPVGASVAAVSDA